MIRLQNLPILATYAFFISLSTTCHGSEFDINELFECFNSNYSTPLSPLSPLPTDKECKQLLNDAFPGSFPKPSTSITSSSASLVSSSSLKAQTFDAQHQHIVFNPKFSPVPNPLTEEELIAHLKHLQKFYKSLTIPEQKEIDMKLEASFAAGRMPATARYIKEKGRAPNSRKSLNLG